MSPSRYSSIPAPMKPATLAFDKIPAPPSGTVATTPERRKGPDQIDKITPPRERKFHALRRLSSPPSIRRQDFHSPIGAASTQKRAFLVTQCARYCTSPNHPERKLLNPEAIYLVLNVLTEQSVPLVGARRAC